ncbi:MarR family winged helix-turn-helix transcriptional regulator [Silvibacterium dinghuense]|uniref:MarR family transcriptional regulator n=1 Tax=Silvibacterium dinghuense TaxID=1560006 RepID=A0A4Q1SFS4_9BACT|nr:MarR family transcriptional regulator [Silvibacterium dinghuense]RXS96404.1 MarR family transcriptional regulator [Silvibacterium dinghuense]GGG90511.1 MarR family transcriptional regulator [Silvibacterium dinghuense]
MSDATASKKEEVSAPRLWVNLARAYGALAAFVQSAVEKEGLGLTDFMVLEVLLHKGPMTISQIGSRVLLAAPSMTAAIDRLEREGYVERRNSEEDRRIRRIELTGKGRGFIQKLFRRHSEELEEVMNVLSTTEKTRLRASLKKVGFSAQAATERIRAQAK